MKYRKNFNSREQICENLLKAVRDITPVIPLIRKENTNKDMSISDCFDLCEQISEYDQYAKSFASQIDLKAVRCLLKNDFTQEEKLAMLYLVFNSDVKYYVRRSIASELKKDLPEEINAIQKCGITNLGLESFIK